MWWNFAPAPMIPDPPKPGPHSRDSYPAQTEEWFHAAAAGDCAALRRLHSLDPSLLEREVIHGIDGHV